MRLPSCRRGAESRPPDRHHHHPQTHPDKDIGSPARTEAHRPRRQDPLSSDSKAEAAPRESSEMLACTEMITMCLQSAKHEHLRKQQEHNQNQNQGFSLVQDVSLLFHSLMVLFVFFLPIVSTFTVIFWYLLHPSVCSQHARARWHQQLSYVRKVSLCPSVREPKRPAAVVLTFL